MRRTILLADDSVTIRKVVELTFCDTDIRVESVATGREALARFGEIHPDLVLADVVMPEPAGYEICRAIKGSERPVPVLLLAGTFEPFDPARAAACGSDGHLVKPFDSRTLVERVEALLSRAPRLPEAPESVTPAEADAQLESMIEDLADAAPAGDLPAVEPDRPARQVPEDPEHAHAVVESAAEEPLRPVEPPVATKNAVDRCPATSPGAAPHERTCLSDEEIERVARRVVERLADKVLREIAWDVVPDLAEAIVRERIRQLEREESEAS